jgi:hypothetical protein
MTGWGGGTPEPDCELCRGSGVDPESGDDHGMPYGVDPGTLEPCPACCFPDGPLPGIVPGTEPRNEEGT